MKEDKLQYVLYIIAVEIYFVRQTKCKTISKLLKIVDVGGSLMRKRK